MASDCEPKPVEGVVSDQPPAEPMPETGAVPTPPVPPLPGPHDIKPPQAVAKTAGGLSLEDFILLNEEIAGMARAGLPLDQGLTAMAKEMGGGKLRTVTTQIAMDLRDGYTLPQSMERQGSKVPPYYARLLAAGIRSGKVADVITTLTSYARTLADLRNMVLSALLYPVVVLVLAMVLFAGVSIYLMPHFKIIFKDFGIKTPFFTQMAFFIFDHALGLFVLLPLAVLAAVLLLRFYVRRTAVGRRNWARFWYAFPIVGVLLRSARLASFADLLGILVDNDVPLPEAFLLAGLSSSDPLMVDGAEQVHRGLMLGVPLGTVLRNQTLVPELVAWMVALGEKRGSLGPTLHQVGDMYRRQVEMRAGLLRSLLPPFLIVLVAGFLVGGFIFTLMLPMLSLIENLGGGKK